MNCASNCGQWMCIIDMRTQPTILRKLMSQIHGNGEVVIGKVQRNGQIQT